MFLFIYFPDFLRGYVKGFWKIYDLTGRAIKGGSIETVASELNISTADLLPGLYVIRVNGAALKLVVEH